jgi:hypothetical protein
MPRGTGRRTRLSRYAEDRCGLNALVRLGLAVTVQHPDGRMGYWLTPRGAALLGSLMRAPGRCRAGVRGACGGA